MTVALLLSMVAPVRALDAVASPAIDHSLYRDGVVRSFERTFDAWTVRCQEIGVGMRRVCNLLTAVEDADGHPRGHALVGTDETGAPMLLIALPPPLAVDTPLVLRLRRDADGKGIARDRTTRLALRPIICGALCKYMTKLEFWFSRSLNDGRDLAISARTTDVSLRLRPLGSRSDQDVLLTIRGEGFARALAASVAEHPDKIVIEGTLRQ